MNPLLNIIQAFQNPQALIQNMMQNQQIMNSPLGNAVNAASKGDHGGGLNRPRLKRHRVKIMQFRNRPENLY